MALDIADDDVRDTNTHTYGPFYGPGPYKQTYQYVNDLDAEVTITLYGTYDGDSESFNDQKQLVQTTVAANTKDRDTLSEHWDVCQFEVTASSTPSSGRLKIKGHE